MTTNISNWLLHNPFGAGIIPLILLIAALGIGIEEGLFKRNKNK